MKDRNPHDPPGTTEGKLDNFVNSASAASRAAQTVIAGALGHHFR